MNHARLAQFAAVGAAVGAATVLILVGQVWQSVQLARSPPLGELRAGLSGRTLEPAVFGFALVGLAGAVAALVTRGWGRRAVGGVVAISGGLLIAAALAGVAPVSGERGRSLIAAALAQQAPAGLASPTTEGTITVASHPQWPVLSAIAGVAIVLAGLVWAFSRQPGRGLPQRYEAPGPAARDDLSLWSALDRGDDPTVTRAPVPDGADP